MKKYPSKVDFWLIALLAGLTMMIGLTAWQSGSTWGFVILIAWLASLAITMVPCYYILCDDHLFIRGGVWKWRIPYKDIQSVKPSQSILAGPALSFQRVEIRSEQFGTILVSPTDRDQFMKDVLQRMSRRA